MAEHRTRIQMHVGTNPPEDWTEQEAVVAELAPEQRTDRVGRPRFHERPPLADGAFPWERLGAEPRFVGTETAECVAALEPSVFWNHGVDEFERFITAVEGRQETALIVSTIGSEQPPGPRRVGATWATHDASVHLWQVEGSIAGRRMPQGVIPQLAPDVRGADRDLALRLRNRPAAAPWWTIELAAAVSQRGGFRLEEGSPGGIIQPILVNQLGEILVGAWMPETRPWRWYVIPAGTEWEQIVNWLVERAIPEFVPAALRRVRAPELVDDELLTARELAAQEAIRAFEGAAALARNRLEQESANAQVEANDVRFALLYGTSKPLADAVGMVFARAGFCVEDLDATMGAGVSADLLVSLLGGRWLVEVKSATGKPSEDLLDDLKRHIETGPSRRPAEPLSGGVLVVNHQHRLAPLERTHGAYGRPDFVASLQHTVIPTLALFAWWRDGNYQPLVGAVTGPPRSVSVQLGDRVRMSLPFSQQDAPPPAADTEREPRGRSRIWRRRA